MFAWSSHSISALEFKRFIPSLYNVSSPSAEEVSLCEVINLRCLVAFGQLLNDLSFRVHCEYMACRNLHVLVGKHVLDAHTQICFIFMFCKTNLHSNQDTND